MGCLLNPGKMEFGPDEGSRSRTGSTNMKGALGKRKLPHLNSAQQPQSKTNDCFMPEPDSTSTSQPYDLGRGGLDRHR